MFNTLRGRQTVFQSSCNILQSHKQCTRDPISPYPQKHLLVDTVHLFNNNHPNGCEVVSCGYDLGFSYDKRCFASSHGGICVAQSVKHLLWLWGPGIKPLVGLVLIFPLPLPVCACSLSKINDKLLKKRNDNKAITKSLLNDGC